MGQGSVHSLADMFKKKVIELKTDPEQVKKDHRGNLQSLMDQYIEDVGKGKADGIRNAKELVEIIKLDLLLVGEATDRVDGLGVGERKLAKISKALDQDAPEVKAMMEVLMQSLNDSNDGADEDEDTVQDVEDDSDTVVDDTDGEDLKEVLE